MAEYQIDVIRRAVAVLRALAHSSEAVGVSELSRELAFGKASTFRILQTLTEEGFVRREETTKRYSLGPELVVLGQAAAEATDIRDHARPVMSRLSSETGLPTYLNVAGAREVVCLEHVPSMGGINLYGAAGHTMPYHACPSGLVLLAFGPDERFERVTEGTLVRYARRTIIDPAKLARALAVVRKQGYATGVDDLEDGVTSVAAPIVGPSGDVVASLGLAGFTHLFHQRIEGLVEAVRGAADELSAPIRSRPATTTAPVGGGRG